jgi:F-type H+-transporting ATPase subunit a
MNFQAITLKAILDTISPAIWTSYIVVAILILFIIITMHQYKNLKPKEAPHGLALMAELLIDWVNTICKEALGEKYWKRYAPYIVTIGMFIFLSNISGLFGLYPATANICITVALGVITGVIMQVTAIKEQGFKAWCKGFTEPFFIFTPMNIVSELMTPVTLGMRLFGNIFSGVMVMNLVYTALNSAVVLFTTTWGDTVAIGTFLAPFITPALHAIFDVFFGAIQAYVFMLLSAFFIAGKIPDEKLAEKPVEETEATSTVETNPQENNQSIKIS